SLFFPFFPISPSSPNTPPLASLYKVQAFVKAFSAPYVLSQAVSSPHLPPHETSADLFFRLLLSKKTFFKFFPFIFPFLSPSFL
ncbi:hypothetical protein, partial [Leuconostoc mesenteroides]|uniref:hypothetical protein n=1 Tax=Leuconostoc mesenteroides TaxID=1245 RepID=UPI001CBAD9A1